MGNDIQQQHHKYINVVVGCVCGHSYGVYKKLCQSSCNRPFRYSDSPNRNLGVTVQVSQAMV